MKSREVMEEIQVLARTMFFSQNLKKPQAGKQEEQEEIGSALSPSRSGSFLPVVSAARRNMSGGNS